MPRKKAGSSAVAGATRRLRAAQANFIRAHKAQVKKKAGSSRVAGGRRKKRAGGKKWNKFKGWGSSAKSGVVKGVKGVVSLPGRAGKALLKGATYGIRKQFRRR